jgi:hypothetical protein
MNSSDVILRIVGLKAMTRAVALALALMAAKLRAMRRPGESYSDVILRVANASVRLSSGAGDRFRGALT